MRISTKNIIFFPQVCLKKITEIIYIREYEMASTKIGLQSKGHLSELISDTPIEIMLSETHFLDKRAKYILFVYVN